MCCRKKHKITKPDELHYRYALILPFLHRDLWKKDQICPKRVFWVKSRKNEHLYGFLRIRNSRGIKFQFKFIILSFWTKIIQKWYFQSKTEKSHFCVCQWSLLKFFHTETNRHDILMPALLLVAETIKLNN